MDIDLVSQFNMKRSLGIVPLDLSGKVLAGKSAKNRDNPEYFGYIYLMVCKDNLKAYVGKHRCLMTKRPSTIDAYSGSGGPLYKNAVIKHGQASFVKFYVDVVKVDPSLSVKDMSEALSSLEKTWIETIGSMNKDTGYNLKPGGDGDWGYLNDWHKETTFVHKGEIQHLIKVSELESYLSQGYVRGMSDATRKKMSENSPIKGIGHTLATRQKMSKNSVGKNLGKKRTAEQRAERSRLQTGKVWVNDGKLTTFVRPEEAESLVSKGWLYGRLRASEETKKKFTELRTGRVWVNDGTSQRFVTKGEAEVLLSDGFVMGRGKRAR